MLLGLATAGRQRQLANAGAGARRAGCMPSTSPLVAPQMLHPGSSWPTLPCSRRLNSLHHQQHPLGTSTVKQYTSSTCAAHTRLLTQTSHPHHPHHAGAHHRPRVRDPPRGPLLRPDVERPRGHRHVGRQPQGRRLAVWQEGHQRVQLHQRWVAGPMEVQMLLKPSNATVSCNLDMPSAPAALLLSPGPLPPTGTTPLPHLDPCPMVS